MEELNPPPRDPVDPLPVLMVMSAGQPEVGLDNPRNILIPEVAVSYSGCC